MKTNHPKYKEANEYLKRNKGDKSEEKKAFIAKHDEKKHLIDNYERLMKEYFDAKSWMKEN